jgi:hypothetical protein
VVRKRCHKLQCQVPSVYISTDSLSPERKDCVILSLSINDHAWVHPFVSLRAWEEYPPDLLEDLKMHVRLVLLQVERSIVVSDIVFRTTDREKVHKK